MSEEEKADLEAECKVAKDLYEVKLQAAADEEVELLRNDPIALEAAFSTKKINDINFNALDHTRPITLPLAKIKRIIKMNPDVKNCGKEASIMITKACEIFTAYIGFKAANLSNLRGAKTIQERDFVHMIHTNEHTDFLREDFPRRQGEDGSKPKSKPKTGANNMVTTTVTNDDGSMTTVEVDASEIATDKMKLANEKKMAAISVGSSKLTGFFNRGDAGVGKSSALAVSSNASSTGGSKNSQDMFSKYASSPSSSKSPLTEAAAEDTEAEGKSIASQMTEPYNFNYTSTARFEDD
jgi:histone H3/H4